MADNLFGDNEIASLISGLTILPANEFWKGHPLSEPEPTPEPEVVDTAVLADSFTNLIDVMKVLAEAVTGYRAYLIELDWDPELASAAAGHLLMHMQNKILTLTT